MRRAKPTQKNTTVIRPHRKPRSLHPEKDVQMFEIIIENPDWLVGAD